MSKLSEHMPWCTFEAPGTIALWDGGYSKCFRFRGTDITNASPSERVRMSERLNTAVRSLGPRWAEHVEGQNNEVAGYQKSEWPTTASKLLDAEREALIASRGRQYAFSQYLTLTEAPPSKAVALTKHLMSSGGTSQRDGQRDDFRRACDGLSKLLRGVVSLEDLDDDETATYLHSTVSTQRHPVSADDHEILSESLGDETFTRGFGLGRLGRSYIAVMSLGAFPKRAHPQFLAALEKLPFEFRWVCRWVGMDRSKAKAMMATREEKALGATEYFKDIAIAKLTGQSKEPPKRHDREQVALATEAGEAMTQLSTRGYGHMTTIFTVCDRNAQRCLEKKAELKAVVQQQAGLIVRDETIEQVKPWRMSLPGNRETGRRTFPLNTRNFADMLPSSSVWRGRDCDVYLAKQTGVRRSWAYTADPVPFRINTDVPGGAAHTLVFGATGQAAKSTLANILAMQFLGWPKAQIISFSVGRSELGPVILNGGAIYSIGAPDSLAFQPLAFVNEPAELRAALEWLQVCLEVVGVEATPARVEALGDALGLLSGVDQRRRTMTELVRDLSTRSPDLALALKAFTRAGHYGHIFDGDDAAAVMRHRWTMFDLSIVLGMSRQALIPACAHMLHRVERWFDGSPTLLHMDEIQEWLGHGSLQRFVKKCLNTRRKDNVRVLMVTPTPSLLAEHKELIGSVMSGCATTFYGPDSKVQTLANSYRAMGVSDVEIEHIKSLKLGEYMLKNQFGTRVFNLRSDGPISLALTGMSSPEELTLLADIGKRCSNADEALWELLEVKGLAKKARSLLGCKDETYHVLADAAQ